MSVEGLGGICPGKGRTLGSIYLRVPANVFKLLNPGKTNGSALVHVLITLVRPASNRIGVYKCSLVQRHGRVQKMLKCLPRSFHFFTGCGACRFLSCTTHLSNVGYGSLQGGTISRVLRGIKLFSMHSQCTGGLSKNVGHHLKVTRTLVRRPGIVVMSRPAAKLSPRRQVHFHGLLSRIDRGSIAVVLSARVINSVSDAYGYVTLVGGKRISFCNSPRSVLERTRKGI